MTRTLRKIFTIILLGVSLPLLVWGFWPPKRETRVVALTPASAGLTLREARNIRVEYAPMVRAGESEVIRVWMEPGKEYQTDPMYEAYTVIAEARLDLQFSDVRPTDVVSTPLSPGDTASFYWEVTPRESETLRGTIWLYLRFLPKGGGEETRVTVSAQEVAIRTGSVLGLTGSEARAAGVVGALVGLALGAPLVAQIGKMHNRKNMTNIT